MWICTNKGFLSVVQPAANDAKAAGDKLLVRARVKAHIVAAFPAATVHRTPGRDYLYRAYIDRADVSAAIAAQIEAIGYGNFKNSVANNALHEAYSDTWRIMGRLQPGGPYGRGAR